jgi:serine/threonine protein kinase
MSLQQIDTLCDQFEAALRNGDTTRIEDFLPKIEEQQRAKLLQELLEVEIQFAAEESGDSLNGMKESFHKRFPGQLDLINSLFRRITKLRKLGDYEILGELGHGGMGIVYKAKQKLLQQTVAIKVLSQTLLDDPQAVGRFKREMQLIGGLTHPNIVRALNAGEIDGTHYLVMEFVDGITLQRFIDMLQAHAGTLPVIPVGAACEICLQASLGLQHLLSPELKLVHRDIKPANLMLDHRGTVKILDLGLGKFVDEHRVNDHHTLTTAGMTIGTVDYIAPEQCENSAEADIRADLYGLGCTLYFLLTGKPVYSGSKYDTVRKKLMAHIVGEVPKLRQLIPSVPSELDHVLQKVLAKDPAERFQTPAEFAEALSPFASFDELWALVGKTFPADETDARSADRHADSPYMSVHSFKKSAPPVNKFKFILLLTGIHFLVFGLIAGVILFMQIPNWNAADKNKQNDAELKLAVQLNNNAVDLLYQWKITEAQAEYGKSLQIYAARFLQLKNEEEHFSLCTERKNLAVTDWLLGDSRKANRELQSLLDSIDKVLQQTLDEELHSRFLYLKKTILRMRADHLLFGGAASGLNKDRFADRILLYNEAIKIHTDSYETRNVQCKKAILLLLNGETEKAKTALDQIPLTKGHDLYSALLRQLANAVLTYYQTEGAERNLELRKFLRQFSIQSNPASEAAKRPEVLELLLFCSEFLLNDDLKNEDWATLAKDVSSLSRTAMGFLRTYPGARPFLRRYSELLLRSADLLYEKLELPNDKQEQIETIVRMLDRLRFSEKENVVESDVSPTLVLFFLPENNKADEGFVIFYPQDGRAGKLFRLPISRQIVKRRDTSDVLPPLDAELSALIAAERQSGRAVRISWKDAPIWSRAEDALTDADFLFSEL